MMQEKKNKLADYWILYLLGGALLIFTAYRTIQLVEMTLPGEAWIIAVVAISAFDVGVPAWMRYYTVGAKSREQILISVVMVVADFVGTSALFVCHTILSQSFFPVDAATHDIIGGVTVFVIVVGVLGNVAGLLAAHLFDPDEIVLRSQRDVRAAIDKMSVEMVGQKKNELARKVAPKLARQTLRDAMGGQNDWALDEEKQPQTPSPKPAQIPAPKPSEQPVPEKRKRGRPRKNPLPTSQAQTTVFASETKNGIDQTR